MVTVIGSLRLILQKTVTVIGSLRLILQKTVTVIGSLRLVLQKTVTVITSLILVHGRNRRLSAVRGFNRTEADYSATGRTEKPFDRATAFGKYRYPGPNCNMKPPPGPADPADQ